MKSRRQRSKSRSKKRKSRYNAKTKPTRSFKAIYIGAGHDAETLTYLPRVSQFVCVDRRPPSIEVFEEAGFQLISQSDTFLQFENPSTKQHVNYYISLFPEGLSPKLEHDLQGADTLIELGHSTHKQILNYLTPTFDLVISCDRYVVLHPSKYRDIDYYNTTWYSIRQFHSKIKRLFYVDLPYHRRRIPGATIVKSGWRGLSRYLRSKGC